MKKIALYFCTALLTMAQASVSTEDIIGQWALAETNGYASSIVSFHEDGLLLDETNDNEGTFQFLNDGKIFLAFEDSVILGTIDKAGEAFRIKGILLVKTDYEVDLSLLEVTEERRTEIKYGQRRTIDAIIQNNLRQIWSAAMQYMLEEGETSASYSDLVGIYFSPVEPVNGESYTNITLNVDDDSISVVDQDGKTHTYEF